MDPVSQVVIALVSCLVYVGGSAYILGWKVTHFLESLKHVIKLEVTDVVGRICLVGMILLAALFLIALLSHEAIELVKLIVRPNMMQHALNWGLAFVCITLFFVVNLIVLGTLSAARTRKSSSTGKGGS